MKHAPIPLLLVLLLILGSCQAAMCQGSASESVVDSLVARWDRADGAAFIEVGRELAQQVVLHDSSFFRVMRQHPNSFKYWLGKLQYSAFTIYDFKDSFDSLRIGSELISLKHGMLDKVKVFKRQEQYRNMALMFEAALKQIQIQYID